MPTPSSSRDRSLSKILGLLAVSSAVMVLGSVVAIWMAKAGVDQVVYVSGLGAPSMPTADLFNTALLLLGLGGVLASVAARGRGHWSRLPVLRAIPVWTMLLVASVSFVVASRVTCTDGCPIPLTPGSTLQDLVHVTAAAIGFTAAAAAMLQVATSNASRGDRLTAIVASIATGLGALTGAGLSLARFRTDIGASLEFVAMTVAVLWLVVFTIGNAVAWLRTTTSSVPSNA